MRRLRPELPSEAIKRYFAAFPALDRARASPPPHTLPPPAWCRPRPPAMLDPPRPARERTHSHRQPRRSRPPKRRCLSQRADADLPEWVTHEGAWELEAHDPVAAFIRALARDAARLASERDAADLAVPDWTDPTDPALDDRAPPRDPLDDTSYAEFEAKFDSSVEAIWRDEPALESLASPLAWRASPASVWGAVDTLHDRLEPLRLSDEPPDPLELSTVASTMRSLTALNHSRTRSSFVEVLPRRAPAPRPPDDPPPPRPRPPSPEENLLTSARTHFRPIGDVSVDGGAPACRYVDGDEFDISGELDAVDYARSASGSLYLDDELYYEVRGDPGDTDNPGDPCDPGDGGLQLKFRAVRVEAGVQTEEARASPRAACDECSRLAGAKRMRPQPALETIWSSASEQGWCGACAATDATPGDARALVDEWSRDWEELAWDIGRYAAEAAGGGGGAGGGGDWWRDRKRRHSAAVWCAARCPRPHHPAFLLCCADRPLTR